MDGMKKTLFLRGETGFSIFPLILFILFLAGVEDGYCRGDHGTSDAAWGMIEDFMQNIRLFGAINGGIGIILIGYWKWGMYQMVKPSLEFREKPALFKTHFGQKGIIVIGLLFLFIGVSSIILCEYVSYLCQAH